MNCQRSLLLVVSVAIGFGLLASGAVAQETGAGRYWDLGVGCYFGGLNGLSELDVARFDWLYLCFGNISADIETVDLLNRLLTINPNLKIVIRLWPIMGIGDHDLNRSQATFLHYLYRPEVKEKLLQAIHDQTRVVLDNIDKPENVIGLTFLEELPGHFSGNPFRTNVTGDAVTPCMERFRKEIEAERGLPLVWDDATRMWWIKKWCAVLDEIHAAMKEASEGRLVFYYQQTNTSTLDWVPEGTPLDQPMFLPLHFGDIIKPGLCDGFFAYPNNETIWNEHYLRLAKANDWLFFSQASHPSGMRLCTWDECVRLAKTEVPQNLGYFFFCFGDCGGGRAWNADPGIPDGPEWNTAGVSIGRHIRRHLALEDVGTDVVRAQPALRLYVDLAVDEPEQKGFLHPRVVVENIRDASFFLDPDEAQARDVKATLKHDSGCVIEAERSGPATLFLGDLAPGQCKVADWWLTVPDGFDGALDGRLVFTARAEGSPATTVAVDGDTAIPFARPKEICASGATWMEAAYRLPHSARPRIVVKALSGQVRRPSVGNGSVAVTFEGELGAGETLTLDPEHGARLFRPPLADDDGAARKSDSDASGYRGLDDGYQVARVPARGRVRSGQPLRVRISGRAEGGAQSLAILRYRTAEGTVDQSVLANQFSTEWREIEATVTPPTEAESLEQVFLYRFQKKGTVWYGPVSVERADASPEGIDVTSLVRGEYPMLTPSLHVFQYVDDMPPSRTPRVRVQLVLPGADG